MNNVFGKRSVGSRKNQEDAYKIIMQSEQDPNSDILLLVSDGMGGHTGGEIASNLAISKFEEHFVSVSSEPKPRARLQEALHVANDALAERIAEKPELQGMGCTFLGVLKLNDQMVWVSVGDSLLYLFRQGKLKQLNADHSLYGELMDMVAEGKITKSEADKHPKRNSLRSAVVGEKMSLIDINKVFLEPGDTLILATDGLDTLEAEQISEIVQTNRGADAAGVTAALLEAVKRVNKSNQDNTTVVVYQHNNGDPTGIHKDSKWTISSKHKRFNTFSIVMLALAGVAMAMILAFMTYVLIKPETPDNDPPIETESTTNSSPQKIGNGEGDVIISVPDADSENGRQSEPVSPGDSSKDKIQPGNPTEELPSINNNEDIDTTPGTNDEDAAAPQYPGQDVIVDRSLVNE